VLVGFSGTAMWYLENNPDGNMDRLTDCFYWAVQTITTVRLSSYSSYS